MSAARLAWLPLSAFVVLLVWYGWRKVLEGIA
jgi:hypothetical protein